VTAGANATTEHDRALSVAAGPPLFAQPLNGDEPLMAEILRTKLLHFVARAADTPRSRQTQIGLSEYGHKCPRRVAMTIAERPAVNQGGDNWASTLGTWFHAGYGATIGENDPDGEWLLDHKVILAGMVPGTLDAYHVPTATVTDFKFSGSDTIKKYRSSGPPAEYIGQVHGYGAAMVEEGFDVRHVALAFFPRSWTLADIWIWTEPFNPEIALGHLKRLEKIHDTLDQLGLWDQRNPELWEAVPAVPGHTCTFCPFWRPGSTNITQGCPGKDAA
jgi:hypothetical protein